MSLEDLQNDWNSIGNSTDQNKISNEQIKSILKSKHRLFINRVLIFELLTLLVYLYFIVLTIFRFDDLEIYYLEILAITAITILILLLVIRIINLIDSYHIRFSNYSHLAAVKKLAQRKITTQKYYLINIISVFLLIVILVVLNIKIYNEYDLIQNRYFWLIVIPSSLIVIVLVKRWIKDHYKKVVRESEDLLRELE